MKRVIYGVFVVASLLGTCAQAQIIWLNEFHYDNIGTDAGEFVEVAAPSSLTALSTITLTLYNGATGASYGTTHTLDTFTVGGNSGGYTFYSLAFPVDGIQNGAPDGFALDQSGSVLQFLSYEGSFAATAGPASGMTSTDIGVTESNTGTPVGGSLGLTGTGSSYAGFSWTTFGADTAGQINSGQTITAVPEPHQYAVFAGLGLLGFAACRRWTLKRAQA
jgi:uncharacterized protein